jgi:sterol desaturase/sphingolipid hydroxylase (fatty acid hydroxylase superfamily)
LGHRWLEWIFVTPRYHHIHHSANKEHYDQNLGNLVTFWDRLLGTHLDPDTLTEEGKKLSFGLEESPNPVRLIAGF